MKFSKVVIFFVSLFYLLVTQQAAELSVRHSSFNQDVLVEFNGDRLENHKFEVIEGDDTPTFLIFFAFDFFIPIDTVELISYVDYRLKNAKVIFCHSGISPPKLV